MILKAAEASEEHTASPNLAHAKNGRNNGNITNRELFLEYAETQSTEVRNKLVELYLPIVHFNAKHLQERLSDEVDADDLISPGVFGLMDAIATYDLSHGVKFETYCVHRVRGAMLDELREMDWVPKLTRSRNKQMRAAKAALEAQLMRPVTSPELATYMGMTEEEFYELQKKEPLRHVSSLSQKYFETDSFKDVTQGDRLQDKNTEEVWLREQSRTFWQKACKGLNTQERLVMLLYYVEGKSMKQVSESMGLSETRISQVHTSVIKRLANRYPDRYVLELGDQENGAADHTKVRDPDSPMSILMTREQIVHLLPHQMSLRISDGESSHELIEQQREELNNPDMLPDSLLVYAKKGADVDEVTIELQLSTLIGMVSFEIQTTMTKIHEAKRLEVAL